jgi:hypothetical protein
MALKHILLLLFLGASAPDTYFAKPNRFEPKELSSEAIYVSVQMCLNQRGGQTAANLLICGCAMDAIRLNIKQGRTDQTATREQIKKCEEPGPKPKPKGKIGT